MDRVLIYHFNPQECLYILDAIQTMSKAHRQMHILSMLDGIKNDIHDSKECDRNSKIVDFGRSFLQAVQETFGDEVMTAAAEEYSS